jgi:UDP-GlcNAc:undecaprenyl-phosphate GlcNAc-1-phosphate transferase
VLVFNSVNWSDGVPGLTPGLVFITLLVIAVSTVRFYLTDRTPELRENSVFVLSILAVMIPAAAFAWYYNLAPKLLLGESGSMFVSFLVASLAILVGGKVATVSTVLGVYLVDAFYVIFARIYNGQSPFKGDRIHHLHYRLLNLGMTEAFIRKFVYSISFLFGMSAVFLDKVGKILLFAILVMVVSFVTKILSLRK